MMTNPLGVLFRPEDRPRAATLYAVLLVASAAFLVALFLLPIRPWWYVAAAVYAVVLVPLVVAFVRLLVARARSLD